MGLRIYAPTTHCSHKQRASASQLWIRERTVFGRWAWSWLEGCGHVADFLDEAKGAGYAFEAVVLVEGHCSLVEGIHDDDSSGDGLGRDDDPLECVGKKCPTLALPLQTLIQGKAGQQNSRYLRGAAASDGLRQLVAHDPVPSERVVRHDRLIFCRPDEGSCDSAGLGP